MDRNLRDELGLEASPLTTEVILSVTEWPARTVERLLEVSEDIVESGRRMYSGSLENVTLLRAVDDELSVRNDRKLSSELRRRSRRGLGISVSECLDNGTERVVSARLFE